MPLVAPVITHGAAVEVRKVLGSPLARAHDVQCSRCIQRCQRQQCCRRQLDAVPFRPRDRDRPPLPPRKPPPRAAGARPSARSPAGGELSLRELAREIGVSHAAPRRHFADKQALLDALALDGFERLGREMAAALEQAGPAFADRLAALARTYVRFATEHGALLDLMYAGKHRPGADALREAADRAFAGPLALVAEGQAAGEVVAGDGERARPGGLVGVPRAGLDGQQRPARRPAARAARRRGRGAAARRAAAALGLRTQRRYVGRVGGGAGPHRVLT